MEDNRNELAKRIIDDLEAERDEFRAKYEALMEQCKKYDLLLAKQSPPAPAKTKGQEIAERMVKVELAVDGLYRTYVNGFPVCRGIATDVGPCEVAAVIKKQAAISLDARAAEAVKVAMEAMLDEVSINGCPSTIYCTVRDFAAQWDTRFDCPKDEAKQS